jgi:hypothetical protein
MHTNGVCILTPRQAHEFEMRGTLPSCRDHHHISKGKADELADDSVVVLSDNGDPVRMSQVRWIGKGKHFMVFERARSWKRIPSEGVTVMQLVPSGGSW